MTICVFYMHAYIYFLVRRLKVHIFLHFYFTKNKRFAVHFQNCATCTVVIVTVATTCLQSCYKSCYKSTSMNKTDTQKGLIVCSRCNFMSFETALKRTSFSLKTASVCINTIYTKAHLDKMPGKTFAIPRMQQRKHLVEENKSETLILGRQYFPCNYFKAVKLTKTSQTDRQLIL